MKHSRAEVVDAAIRAIAHEGPDVTVAQIATAAGVSNGTLFHYFPSKQALLDAVYAALKAEFAEAVIWRTAGKDGPPVEVLHDLWSRWIAWARRHPERHRAMQTLYAAGLVSPEVQAAGAESLAGPLAALHQAHSDGQLVDLPVDHLSALLVAQLEFTITSALTNSEANTAFLMAWRSITRPDIDTTHVEES